MAPSHVVVFDSSALIPLILPASRTTRLFSRLEPAGWRDAVTPQLLDEVRQKLTVKESVRAWLKLSDVEIDEFLEHILPAKTVAVPGRRQVHGVVKADPDDDKIVAAALESGADYIISEDRHLLELREYQGIRIMNREEFVAELDRLGVT